MGTINDGEYKKIKELYSNGFSANDLSVKYAVSLDAIFYFLRKHNIPRRSARENNLLQFNKKLPSFNVKSRLTSDDKILKVAGVMLYWGEGSKWQGEKIVDFANSDPAMIKIFLKFLRKICGINDDKLRAYLYCYANQNPDELLKFWSKITNISSDRFTKPYIKKDFKEFKAGKMKYGLIHIRYYDKKLLNLIRDWIKEYSENIGSVA